jgi:hypothetical protein
MVLLEKSLDYPVTRGLILHVIDANIFRKDESMIKISESVDQDNIPSKTHNFPQHAYLAGFWLVAGVLGTLLMSYLTRLWIPHQGTRQPIFLIFVFVVIGGTAYLWTRTLVTRSGLKANIAVGLVGASFFLLTVFGLLVVGEPFFGIIFKGLNIPQTGSGTRSEFFVIFVLWTGIVTGGTGFGVGLALKRPKLALKLLLAGLVCGAAVFFAVAFIMEIAGFKVGTPRPDGIPSMPIVTVLGICCAALVGSEVFGRIIARNTD